jgi:hypothetical protein
MAGEVVSGVAGSLGAGSQATRSIRLKVARIFFIVIEMNAVVFVYLHLTPAGRWRREPIDSLAALVPNGT